MADPGGIYLSQTACDQVRKILETPFEDFGERRLFDDNISFSTGPQSAKTHWPMLLYRTPARIYSVGETFSLKVDTPDLSEHHKWSWQTDSPH